MRQISIDDTAAVSGADCGDLTVSVGFTGISISGSASDWGSCLDAAATWAGDAFNSFSAHYVTGIPYGEAHVG